MARFARGFKSDCERIVASVRDELAVGDLEPIDMNALASHLDIPLAALSDHLGPFGQRADAKHIEEIYRKVSAFTYFAGRRRCIVYNDSHSVPRHRSNIAHELAHALLHHPPEAHNDSDDRTRLHEVEAAWLGGVLMLTREQAFYIATSRLAYDDAAARFGVSREMLTYRLNVTGALRYARFASRVA